MKPSRESPFPVVRRADGRVMPWKNGGGSTLELTREPGALPDDPPALRVSIADLTADGPFSSFPHVDRVILLLEGPGVRLRFPERDVTLDRQGEPFAFPGEAPCHCTLLAAASGPALVRDLNLMVDRRRHHLAARAVADEAFEPPPEGARHLVVALDPHVALHTPDGEVTLSLGDLAEPPRGGRVTGRALLATVSLAHAN
jgi:environmental stress-induced protein Ves